MNRQQIFALVAVVGLSFGLYAYMSKQSRLIDYPFEYEDTASNLVGNTLSSITNIIS